MSEWLPMLKAAGENPLTYVAFIILITAWLTRSYFLSTQKYITALVLLRHERFRRGHLWI
jgi:hypothetical protein